MDHLFCQFINYLEQQKYIFTKTIKHLIFTPINYSTALIDNSAVWIMFGNHYESQLEEALLENFTRLKDTLSESNYINIGNMHCLTVNMGILTDYVKDAFRSIIKVVRAYQEKTHILISIIKKSGLEPQIPRDLLSPEIINTDLAELNQKIADHIAQQNQTNQMDSSDIPRRTKGHKQKSFSSRATPQMRREQFKHQQGLVSKFVETYLKSKMQRDPNNTTIIHKTSILSIFLKWLPSQNCKADDLTLSNVQMCLTNELKKTFPGVLHNYRSFRGLRFIKDQKDLIKYTEIKENMQVEQDSSSIQSPPLPNFEDDYLAQ